MLHKTDMKKIISYICNNRNLLSSRNTTKKSIYYFINQRNLYYTYENTHLIKMPCLSKLQYHIILGSTSK